MELIKELKIGNIIGHVYSDYPNIVTGIKTHCVWLDCMVSSCDFSTDDTNDGINGLHGEPLTKEWFDKLKIKKINNSMFRIEDITFQPHTDMSDFSFRSGWKLCYKGKLLKVIYYVHDLQNTFEALYSKKLKL